ncbi:MAG: 50S ribosomal protein L22 [Patescibacteria group bacterium]
MSTTVIAKLNYLRIAPRKVRLLADVVRGLRVNDAEAQFYLASRRSGVPLMQLLRSAVANAKQVLKAEPSALYIKEIRVDLGPKTKRYTPRARGSVSLIEKKQSHVTIVLGVMDKEKEALYTFRPRPKKEEKSKVHPKKTDVAKKEAKPNEEKSSGVKSESRKRGFRKMFQRKSV